MRGAIACGVVARPVQTGKESNEAPVFVRDWPKKGVARPARCAFFRPGEDGRNNAAKLVAN